jgi:hypothetical protein
VLIVSELTPCAPLPLVTVIKSTPPAAAVSITTPAFRTFTCSKLTIPLDPLNRSAAVIVPVSDPSATVIRLLAFGGCSVKLPPGAPV